MEKRTKKEIVDKNIFNIVPNYRVIDECFRAEYKPSSRHRSSCEIYSTSKKNKT